MTDTKLKLFALVLANGRASSPYVWRIRYALAYKGIDPEIVPLGFTEIPKTFGGRFATLPVIQHGESEVGDSWDIAQYLDRTFPEKLLFRTPGEYAMARLSDEWFAAEVSRRLFRVLALDVHDAARAEDQAYFRASREQRLKGRTLEQFTAKRESELPALRQAFTPVRAQLARFPFLGGSEPNYADYIGWSALQWAATVATIPLFEAPDPLRSWVERGFDLYDGIGRDPRMKPLFE